MDEALFTETLEITESVSLRCALERGKKERQKQPAIFSLFSYSKQTATDVKHRPVAWIHTQGSNNKKKNIIWK